MKERYQQQRDKLREAAKRFYKDKGRAVKLDRYAGGGRSAAKEKYQQQQDKLRDAARRFHWKVGFEIKMAKYLFARRQRNRKTEI